MRTIFLCLTFVSFGSAAEPAAVDYSRDVKPIFLNSCYACHGPDEKQRKGNLRLDVRDEAVKSAVKPGNSKDSPLIQRLISKDSTEVMPPPKAKKPALTAVQIETLRRWIDQGAPFEQHWAYRPTASPELPKGTEPHPIDRFVNSAIKKAGITPAAATDPITLIRRMSFDLTGLPPTIETVDAFIARPDGEGRRSAVRKLLDSPHFGERMAVMWLDAVRYADTAGYHSDNHRDVWMFRDYVIESFNKNRRFDQFTLEQLAGDLMPGSTNEQRIASGYNRMLMTTEEGGAQAKEYTAKYAADRVRNTASAWLGATLGCAECHNHKYDPYTTRDFYRFAAFFADVQEVPVGRQPQTPIMAADMAKKAADWDAKLKELSKQFDTVKVDAEKQKAWEDQSAKNLPKGLARNLGEALRKARAERDAAQQSAIDKHYRESIAPESAEIRKKIAAETAARDAFLKNVPTTLVSTSTAPRMIRILPRGNWLDDSGEVVTPGLPSFLGAGEKKDRLNRLDLARWMVDPTNPLTARVFVNRLWKLAFGKGLVRNMDDFGTQGTSPTHPELLDWLAAEFVKSGWDVKKMLELMLTSETYARSSISTKEQRERDVDNIYLSRQNRFRVDAEFVRDTALSVSGLMTTKVGGPSAKPYQPAGYWSYLNFPKREWKADANTDQYRRGLYTYWCRSFLHPSLAAFDAPSREECTNERTRSSTPLQALVLLNDPTYVESARVLGGEVIRNGGGTSSGRVAFLFRRALSRNPTVEEARLVEQLVAKEQESLKGQAATVKALISQGIAPVPAGVDPTELAAWTAAARVILNLHETVTRN